MEHLHYVIIIIAVIAIIFFQISFFIQNRTKLNLLKKLFPNNINGQLTITEEDSVSTINVQGKSSPIFIQIVDTLNNYLIENKGAASDFHLIKDVVDRHCDSVEEEVSTLTPIPLYFGLIGTMIGILIGVGYLVLTGGIDALLSSPDITNLSEEAANLATIAHNEKAVSGVSNLLGGVALAMVSSIIGIALTTYGSGLTKGAKSQLNKDKNIFYSWIQVKLLPSLSNNATSAIYTLQNNLTTFNNTFSQNIEGMNEAFAVVGESYADQLELMNLLRDLDIRKMATANIKVLKELQKSTNEFETFNQYLHNVSSYIENVQKLNSGLNEHLNRTQVIEKMGEFFKNEIEQIESRKGLINSVVGEIDETLNRTLNKLEDNAEKQLNFFIEKSVTLQEKFASAIDEQAIIMQSKLKETSLLLNEMKNLKEIKSSMSGVEIAMREQNVKLDKLISAFKNNNNQPENGVISKYSSIPKSVKVSFIATCITIGIAALLFIVTTVIDLTSENNSQDSNKIENTNNTPKKVN